MTTETPTILHEQRRFNNPAIDRSNWEDGLWKDGEPDKAQWIDGATGLDCMAVRQRISGAWCGYVGVPEGHPEFGVTYSDYPEDSDDNSPYVNTVHGGITFTGLCRPGQEEFGVCHVPIEGRTDRIWWLGFDCAHKTDYTPNGTDEMSSLLSSVPFALGSDDTGSDDPEDYKSLEFVQHECASLAAQLAAVMQQPTADEVMLQLDPRKSTGKK